MNVTKCCVCHTKERKLSVRELCVKELRVRELHVKEYEVVRDK